MNRTFLAIVLICCIIGSFLILSPFSECRASPLKHRGRISRKIAYEFGKKLKEKRGLQTIGSGGRMMDDIEVMFIHLQCYEGVLDLEACRKLLVELTEEYFYLINNNLDVRPYLHNYPFEAKNINIFINLYASDSSYLPSGKISFISQTEGVLRYRIEFEKLKPYQTIREETYEEAKELVNLSSVASQLHVKGKSNA